MDDRRFVAQRLVRLRDYVHVEKVRLAGLETGIEVLQGHVLQARHQSRASELPSSALAVGF